MSPPPFLLTPSLLLLNFLAHPRRAPLLALFSFACSISTRPDKGKESAATQTNKGGVRVDIQEPMWTSFILRLHPSEPWSQRFFLIFLLFATRVHRFATLLKLCHAEKNQRKPPGPGLFFGSRFRLSN